MTALSQSFTSSTFFLIMPPTPSSFFFFFNDTATTEFYPFPLPDALPIYVQELVEAAREEARRQEQATDQECDVVVGFGIAAINGFRHESLWVDRTCPGRRNQPSRQIGRAHV